MISTTCKTCALYLGDSREGVGMKACLVEEIAETWAPAKGLIMPI